MLDTHVLESPLGTVPSPSSRERARVREQGVAASRVAHRRRWAGDGQALDLIEDSEGDELDELSGTSRIVRLMPV
jgi:hypothetical protein